MSGSVYSNGATATRSLSLAGVWNFVGWSKSVAASFTTGSGYQYFVRLLSWAYAVEVYSQLGSGEHRIYSGPIGEIAFSTGSSTDWYGVRVVKDGTDVLAQMLNSGGTAWVTIAAWSVTDAELLDVKFFEDAQGKYGRSASLFDVAHTEAEDLSEIHSAAVVDTTNCWAAWFGGATPAADGSDTSGNSRPLTVTGTLAADSDDPISGGGPTTETLTVTGAASSASSGSAFARQTRRESVTGATSSASAGAALTRLSLTASGGAASATPGSAAARLSLLVTGAASASTPGTAFARATARYGVTGVTSSASAGVAFARAVQRLTVTGVSSAASAGTIRTACTLHAAGATCSASAGQAYAVSDGSLQITGASCAAVPGQAYARLTQRFAVTGAACTSTPGAASARQVTALVVTGATAASVPGVARHALTLRASGDSCTASGGLASVNDGFTPITWETSEITLHVASVQAYTRTARLDLDGEMQPLVSASRVRALGAYVRTRNLELSYL